MKLVITFLLMVCCAGSMAKEAETNQKLFSFDENYWVLFYDLPSRRFRAIRNDFIQGHYGLVSQNLRVAENHIRIEATRSTPPLTQKLIAVSDKLAEAAVRNENNQITVAEFNPLFAQAHWLLSQHFLTLSLTSKQNKNDRNAGHYLAATAHHVERAILWSDMKITPQTLQTLEEIAKQSNELLNAAKPLKVYKKRPIKKAWELIKETGDYLEKTVTIHPDL